jgi:ATP-binding cassette, subfamily B, bacterial
MIHLDDELPIPAPPHAPKTAWRFVLHVARGRYRRWLWLLVACETAQAVSGIALPYALNRIVTAVSAGRVREAGLLAVLRPLLLFGALCLGELLFGRIAAAIHMRIAPRQRQYVARALFHHLHRHSHRFLSENFAGALAHRISETSHGVNNVLWALLTELWPIVIVITCANLMLAFTNPWLGGFCALWSLIFVGLSLYLSRRTQPLSHAASNARSHSVGKVVDSVSNHAAVRLFARVNYERSLLDRSYHVELATVLRANHAMEQIRLFQFAASALLKAGTLTLAVLLASRGAISVGQFVMSVSLSMMVIAEVRNLSRRFLELFESLGNVDSGVREILRPHELIDSAAASDPAIERAAIVFDAVDFRYPGGTHVFKELSVTIPAGQRVGLVGLSGSGKSSFVSLLLRLYDPQHGSIRVAGHDVRSLTQDALHRQIGLIPQDPTLFHRSLRDNIRYGRVDASDAEVERAAWRAHASEFIAELPEGYDAQVGERGVKLSGGQRQRIAIARVILKDAPVLILDEATSSLDSLTEHAIQAALDDVMVDKTVIVVAHRLSTIAHLDRILVFAGGRIVEDGSHAELVQRRGTYHALWKRQRGGLIADESEPQHAHTVAAE